MSDLFQHTPTHDPGGKSTFKMIQGVTGDAEFYGENDCYRLWLSREWREFHAAYALFIGLNPSTAGKDVDDPTVRREVDFTISWGLGAYLKMNIMDYRATERKRLRDPAIVPCGPRNLSTIREKAADAERIVLAWGTPHKKLRRYADQVLDALRADNRTLFCFGLNKDGSPQHPLYLPKTAELMEFPNA